MQHTVVAVLACVAVRVRAPLALLGGPMPRSSAVIGVPQHAAGRATPLFKLDEHVPARPGFDCARCDEPWPCAPAKVLLSEEYAKDRLALRLYLNLQCYEALAEAIAGHDWPKVDDLYERMVGWAASL